MENAKNGAQKLPILRVFKNTDAGKPCFETAKLPIK
jgi:hypothetical protein